jgi:acetoin utilization protein AcuB
MLARYWMTKCPLALAAPETDLFTVFRLMRTNGVRRLPITRNGGEDGELLGMIALSDLYGFASPASLSRDVQDIPQDVRKTLAAKTAGQVMKTDVATCEINTALEEIGLLMRERKIGAVPVMNGRKLAGIITESDVLAALAEVTRAGDDSSRICLRVAAREKLDLFREILDICARCDSEIFTLLTHPLRDDNCHLIMMKVRGKKREELIQALWDSDFQVLIATGDSRTAEH